MLCTKHSSLISPGFRLLAQCRLVGRPYPCIPANLRALLLYPLNHKAYIWSDHPAHFKTSFITALPLSSLRRLSLFHHHWQFSDAVELDSLLGNAVGLTDLVLCYVKFANTNPHISASVPRTKNVTLDSLYLQDIGPEAHLRCLELVDKAVKSLTKPLLAANAISLQIIIIKPSTLIHQHFVQPINRDILAGENKLSRIISRSSGLGVLTLFGNLENLKMLQTLALDIQKDILVSTNTCGGIWTVHYLNSARWKRSRCTGNSKGITYHIHTGWILWRPSCAGCRCNRQIHLVQS
ncbi:hypothetical protein C8J57DRAFT_1606910 [Mycena rebaudengoi]|nr:hypothetical protein C8J57DRAFT_1606910 [Mycena rebaudengoi]